MRAGFKGVSTTGDIHARIANGSVRAGRSPRMRELASAIYWTLTGALISFSFLVAFGHIVGIPFMVVGVVMAFVGLVKWWTRGVWAITVGLIRLTKPAIG